jgi:uncharacterized protein (TIGR02217 family)
MEFLETPAIPACPKFGATSEPDYSVTITATAGGWEYRNLNTAESLTRVNITVGPGPELDEEVQELLEFWHALGGPHIGFRYRNHADYKSCRVRGTPSSTDQPLVLISGSDYQITKRYTAGAQSRDRAIKKPAESTILIADAGTLKTPTTHYTIDDTTGIVSILFSPVGDLTWGGEYDIPVRFDSSFPVEQLQWRVQSVSFSLKEFRVE